MMFYTRRKGSSRTSEVKSVTFDRLSQDRITLWDGERHYFIIPENEAEIKELMSIAHIIHHYNEPRLSIKDTLDESL